MQITVAGTGRFAQPPERATLTLTAGFESGDKARVLTDTTRLVEDLTARLRELERRDPSPVTTTAVLPIQTQSWHPYTNSGRPAHEQRHSATARIVVTFAEFAALSELVEAVGGLPGVSAVGVEWALTDATRERTEAAVLAQAVARARTRATTIAHAAGALDVQFCEIADPGLLERPGDAQAQAVVASGSAFARDGGGGGGIELLPEDVVTIATVHARFEAT